MLLETTLNFMGCNLKPSAVFGEGIVVFIPILYFKIIMYLDTTYYIPLSSSTTYFFDM